VGRVTITGNVEISLPNPARVIPQATPTEPPKFVFDGDPLHISDFSWELEIEELLGGAVG
jgi:hypothetical protein